MYRNVDEALKESYKRVVIGIQPKSGTAAVCDNMERGGATICGAVGLLSPEDRLTDVAWVIDGVESVLNDYELAVVELCYTSCIKADGIVDLVAFIRQQNKGVNIFICEALVFHIFGNLKQEAIQDKYDLGRKYIYRQKKKVNAIVNALLNSAWAKLDPEFRRRGIIGRERPSDGLPFIQGCQSCF
ncbi:hypothetical protein GJV52_12325 [Neisseria brasiliensis]|uniref:hypothetical protein n=1 Tax=Neisseria TaxID=482 RepID=UPI000C27BDFC|nr:MULTISPECIES: hypothetical protein [Neisseria]PJO78806.1 hypothetical protein CWC45_02815 [Neisseria sp. N177_16]QGL26242.1 hypothetical protein GJV52_12325 [Neisseria brasiliensis]